MELRILPRLFKFTAFFFFYCMEINKPVNIDIVCWTISIELTQEETENQKVYNH